MRPALEALRAEAAVDEWLEAASILEKSQCDMVFITNNKYPGQFILRISDVAYRGKYNRDLGTLEWDSSEAPIDSRSVEKMALEAFETLKDYKLVGFELNRSTKSVTLYKSIGVALLIFPATGSEESISLCDKYVLNGDYRGDVYLKVSDRIFAKTERR